MTENEQRIWDRLVRETAVRFRGKGIPTADHESWCRALKHLAWPCNCGKNSLAARAESE